MPDDGGKRTIYVRSEDAELWHRAERAARQRRLSMSAVIMTALEAWLDAEARHPPAPGSP